MDAKKVQAELENMMKIPPLYQFANAIHHGLDVESSEVCEIIITLLEKAEDGEFK